MKTKHTTDMERLWKALEIMKLAHEGQTDKCGQPYWIHTFVVAMGCFHRYHHTELSSAIVGALHDVLEDTDYTLDEINATIELSEEEYEALMLLKRDRKMSYSDYIENIIKSNNQIAIRVKVQDLNHNINLKRFVEAGIEVTDKDEKRVRKYEDAFYNLLPEIKGA